MNDTTLDVRTLGGTMNVPTDEAVVAQQLSQLVLQFECGDRADALKEVATLREGTLSDRLVYRGFVAFLRERRATLDAEAAERVLQESTAAQRAADAAAESARRHEIVSAAISNDPTLKALFAILGNLSASGQADRIRKDLQDDLVKRADANY